MYDKTQKFSVRLEEKRPGNEPQSCGIHHNIVVVVFQAFDGFKKPVVFVLPGTNTKWGDVGNQLQKLPIFGESIARSADLLYSKGFNLYTVLKTTDPVALQDPLASIVASTVIQVRQLRPPPPNVGWSVCFLTACFQFCFR